MLDVTLVLHQLALSDTSLQYKAWIQVKIRNIVMNKGYAIVPLLHPCSFLLIAYFKFINATLNTQKVGSIICLCSHGYINDHMALSTFRTQKRG